MISSASFDTPQKCEYHPYVSAKNNYEIRTHRTHQIDAIDAKTETFCSIFSTLQNGGYLKFTKCRLEFRPCCLSNRKLPSDFQRKTKKKKRKINEETPPKTKSLDRKMGPMKANADSCYVFRSLTITNANTKWQL